MMNNTQFLLNRLAEEASEIAQIALKAAEFGMDSVYVSDANPKALDNAHLLKGELNDLMGVIDLMIEETEFIYDPDLKAIEAKKEKIKHFRAYSQKLGLTT